MKRNYFLKILFFVLIIILISHLIWRLSPPKKMEIYLLDKTVLDKSAQEHRSFNWLLNYEKYITKQNKSYKIDQDYFGFFPKDNFDYKTKDLWKYNEDEIDSLSQNFDLAYYTDTYGIYSADWFNKESSLDFSKKIYGGLTNNDYLFLRSMKMQNKPVIIEFNTIASPTPFYVRKKVEDLYKINWSGWTGRYFSSLDTLKNVELPNWLISNYKRFYDKKWNYKESGIVLVHSSGKPVVLENNKDLDFAVPKILTPKKRYRDYYNLPKEIIYPFWFDITFSENIEKDYISSYEITTNSRGDSILADNKIPKRFPAVISHKATDNFFYFAGDYADNETFHFLSYFSGTALIGNSFLYQPRLIENRSRFFWKYYLPLMTKILEDFHENNN